jgi:hypothetical protein
MPAGSKKSRDAKAKQGEGCTTFTNHAVRPLSVNASNYNPLDNLGDESLSDVDSSNSNKGENQAQTSVIALQHLYSVFLPHHLQLKEDAPSRDKQQKIKNRPPIYTGDSWTTKWRKDIAQRKAVQGCRTLDRFIKREVSVSDQKSKASH